MNTSEILQLIQQKKLEPGAYTVNVKPGAYADIMGRQVLVYTNSKPDSSILPFSVKEFILIIESAKTLSLDSFKNLIMAKKMFCGEVFKN